MGIINITPDSFYCGSRGYDNPAAIRQMTEIMISDGADFIDIGAYSTRPGADPVSAKEEGRRIALGLEAIRSVSKDIPVSVDTFRAEIASLAVTQFGADIINDISGGDLDPDMGDTVARLNVPYIIMHSRGNPETMQSLTDYPQGIIQEVVYSLANKIRTLSLKGVADIIIDPGFGFAKTLDQNYRLLDNLGYFETLGRPVLVGVSRKSMITRLLDITADQALNGTTAVNTLALDRGASILRVHDVKPAVQAVSIYCKMKDS